MKALMQIGYGDIETNVEIKEIEIPIISDNEVLIKVHCASINPHDYKVIKGEFKKIEKLNFPAFIGSDFSGTIVAAGINVIHFVPGDEVFGTAHGTLAEFCKTDISTICLKPKNISFEKIASLSVVGMTTIQAFKRIGGIKKGDRVLIHAGSGGVGSFAIQYAKLKGAFVYTTTSTKNIKWVKNLGANVVIDYKNENYLNVCTDLDIVFDTLGHQYTFDAFKIIKQCGKIISLLPAELNKQVAIEFNLPRLITFLLSLKPSRIQKLIKRKEAQYEFVFMHPNNLDLLEITRLVEADKVKAVIDSLYSFYASKVAFKHISEGHAKGKIVIKI